MGPQRALWLAAAGVFASILPHTVVNMMPTNKEIIAAADRGEAAKAETLRAWGPLHTVRTMMSTLSAALMAYALYKL